MTTTTLSARPSTATKPHIVSRVFDAPRDLVWKVNTEAEHLCKWLAPEGFSAIVKSMDFRPGGIYHYAQISPDGGTYMWGKVTYLEITPKDRIVLLQNFSDEDGGISTHPMAPDWPRTMYSVSTLEDLGDGRTRLTIEWTPVEGSGEKELALFDSMRGGMDQGWKGTLDKLEAYLKTAQQ